MWVATPAAPHSYLHAAFTVPLLRPCLEGSPAHSSVTWRANADIVGFTDMSNRLPAGVVLELLNQLYTLFDGLTTRLKVYKVDTVGGEVAAGAAATAAATAEELEAGRSGLLLDEVGARDGGRRGGSGAGGFGGQGRRAVRTDKVLCLDGDGIGATAG